MIIRIYQCTNCNGEWGSLSVANKHVCNTKKSGEELTKPDATDNSIALGDKMNGYTCGRCGAWCDISYAHYCLSVQPIQYAAPPVALTPICNCASEISELRKAVKKLTQELALLIRQRA